MVTREIRLGVIGACALLVSATVSSHEVPVHVALTNKAVDYLVQFRPELAACTPTLKSQLAKGVTAEDDYFEPIYYPLGRFFFHFLPQLSDVPRTTFGPAVTDAECDSPSWARLGGPCVATLTLPLFNYDSGPRSNLHAYTQMVSDLSNSPGSAAHDRGLVSLGHYLHLLQDLTSPAHTRSDAHPHFQLAALGIDRLGDPSLFEVVNANRTEADVRFPSAPLLTWPTAEAAFFRLQKSTASRFWSEKNTLNGPGPQCHPMTPDGCVLDAGGYALDVNKRRIAHRNARTGVMTINDVVAREQFDELAPEAVLYTASMIDYIIETEKVTLCDVEPFTGTWGGTYTFGPMKAVLEQTGSVVTGEITDAARCLWRVSGSVSGSQLSLPSWTLLNDPGNPAPPVCVGGTVTMSGTLAASPTSITGTGKTVLASGSTFPWTFTLTLN